MVPVTSEILILGEMNRVTVWNLVKEAQLVDLKYMGLEGFSMEDTFLAHAGVCLARVKHVEKVGDHVLQQFSTF